MTEAAKCMHVTTDQQGRRWCPNPADPDSPAGRPRCTDHNETPKETR